jgi:hypothetical protein
MWFWTKEDVSPQRTFNAYEESLQNKIYELETQLGLVMNERDTLIDKFREQAEAAPFCMDMVMMNVFSIERRENCTVVGWVFDNGTTPETREWWIITSLETHDRLVTEFTDIVTKRNIE